tara:strand:- start:46 stop:1743 length:1698 start_codon:yes stop_codon:yes gene_type:complete
MMQFILFVKSSFKEINPWHNIKVLRTNIKGDIISGITVAIIALPMALAFGDQSGLGPIAGVLGAIAGGIVGGLFGGCMVGVSGPTLPKAMQIASFMTLIAASSDDPFSAAFSIIFLSGLILVIISMLKISKFIHYIPYSVVAGFMCGIGVMVLITQINPFLGLPIQGNIPDVFKNFGNTIQNSNIAALYVAIPSLLILLLWKPIQKKLNFLKSIPSPLVALIAGTAIAYFMKLKIPYIGTDYMKEDIFSFYIPNLIELTQFIGPAFALAGLAILDSLLSCKVADNMTGTRHNSDRETFGQGMANMAAGLFGGVTTATATMRTVANIKFGGKTPLASIVHGLVLLAILLGLGFLVAVIPKACLAAILFKVGIDILDYRILPVLRNIPLADFLIFIIVLFVTAYGHLMTAVGIGVAFACISYIREVTSTLKSTYNHQIIPFSKSDFISENHNIEQLVKLPISVLQLQGPLFFGSIEHIINTYANADKHEILIIDMHNVTMIDLSGVYGLEDLIKNVQSHNIKVFVSNTHPDIEKTLKKVNFIDNIGKDFYKDSKESISNTVLALHRL